MTAASKASPQLTSARAAAPHPAAAGRGAAGRGAVASARVGRGAGSTGAPQRLADASVDGAVPRTPALQAEVSTPDDATLTAG
ncbi:MAG: hypothetical protein R2838_03735 [Caldilineaceae bacterium]